MSESGTRSGRQRYLKWRRWMAGIIVVLLLGVTIDYWAYPYGAPMPGHAAPSSQNGLWLRYSWYFGEGSESEVANLSKRLQADQIRYAFFHVRNLSRTGDLVHRHESSAMILNAIVRRDAPHVKRIAWIYAGNRSAGGLVDWNRPEIRQTMVAQAKWLVQTCGFDGVQWDCEIAAKAEPGLVALLQESRLALGKQAFIGFAAPMWLPAFGIGWDDVSFRKIAENCDQIAVMAYDTGAYFPRMYASLITSQRDQISKAIAGTGCTLLIGLPTYDRGLRSHNPRSENLSMALRGLRNGTAVIEGVSLFADYTTDESEWRIYRRDWLGRP